MFVCRCHYVTVSKCNKSMFGRGFTVHFQGQSRGRQAPLLPENILIKGCTCGYEKANPLQRQPGHGS
jgi:hypothetical protein